VWSSKIVGVLLLATVSVGAVMGYFGRTLFAFSTKGELDINDFFTLVLGALVALYIGESVKSRSADRRREKDILMERIDELIRSYRTLTAEFQTVGGNPSITPQDRTQLSRQFKLASSNLTTVENLLPRCRAPKKCRASMVGIRQSELQFKKVVTGAGTQYRAGDLMRGIRHQRELEEKLVSLQIEINVAP